MTQPPCFDLDFLVLGTITSLQQNEEWKQIGQELMRKEYYIVDQSKIKVHLLKPNQATMC